ncbi:TPA: phage gp6-like head-tail connector protein [Klebsiella variicola]|nr:phage gp6-like head-tail connector protein [Klebsiella variicola]
MDDVKNQLRLELDFTEHDAMLTQMVNAAQRSIERDYYCKLVTSDEELQALPETVRGFIADEDIRLAIQFLVSDAYLNGHIRALSSLRRSGSGAGCHPRHAKTVSRCEELSGRECLS